MLIFGTLILDVIICMHMLHQLSCISVSIGFYIVLSFQSVVMLIDQQELSVMVFSTDETTNKVVVSAGVPQKGDKGKLDVSEWLSNALGPLKGRCGKGKGGLATGQVSILLTTHTVAEEIRNTFRS